MILLPTEWPVTISKRMKLKRGTTTRSAWIEDVSWYKKMILYIKIYPDDTAHQWWVIIDWVGSKADDPEKDQSRRSRAKAHDLIWIFSSMKEDDFGSSETIWNEINSRYKEELLLLNNNLTCNEPHVQLSENLYENLILGHVLLNDSKPSKIVENIDLIGSILVVPTGITT